jgi:hypothetical protein
MKLSNEKIHTTYPNAGSRIYLGSGGSSDYYLSLSVYGNNYIIRVYKEYFGLDTINSRAYFLHGYSGETPDLYLLAAREKASKLQMLK